MEQKAIDRRNDFLAQRKAEFKLKNMLKDMESVKKRQRIFQNEYKSVDYLNALKMCDRTSCVFRRKEDIKLKIHHKLERAEQRRKCMQLEKISALNKEQFHSLKDGLKRGKKQFQENIETYDVLQQKSKQRIQVFEMPQNMRMINKCYSLI